MNPLLLLLLLPVMHCQTYTLLSMESTLERYSSITVTLHSHLLPQSTPFTLVVQEAEASIFNATPVAVDQRIVNFENEHRLFEVWNYGNDTKVITISLKADSNTSVSPSLFFFAPNQQVSMFTAIIDDSQTSGYMLPFNMLKISFTEVFVLARNATLTPSSYSLPPFMSTYWTQNKVTASAMPWLPFFSYCSFQEPYIILNDIIRPSQCQSDVYNNIKCEDKSISWDCLIQQFELTNVYQEYWFNAANSTSQNIIEILFFLFPKQLTADEVNNFRTLSETAYSQLFDSFSSELIPVIYTRNSNDPVNVNVFNMVINVDLNYGEFYEIVTADISGQYDQNIPQPYGKLNIHVNYINLFKAFMIYNISIHAYIIIFLLIALLMVTILKCIQKKFLGFHVTDNIKFMISPAIKGIAYTILTSGVVAVLIHIFSFYTNYSSISATYDSSYTGQPLRSNNKGRYGLALLFAGIMIVMSGIKQAFKVNETEELKIALEDDKWEFENEQQLQKKIDFSKKSQISHRRFIFNGLLVALIYSVVIFYLLIQTSNLKTCLFILLYPLFNKAFVHLLKRYLVQSYIFICSLMVSLQLLPCYLILNHNNFSELLLLYFSKYFSFIVIEFILEVRINKFCLKLQEIKDDYEVAKVLYNFLEEDIKLRNNENQYEKALSYSILTVSLVTSIILYPFLAIFIYYTRIDTQIASILIITQDSLIMPIILFLVMAPLQLYAVLLLIEFLKKQHGIRIEETVRYNHFKFMRVKFRWISDVFAQSKQIREEYREYQKFAFSSQLYYVITLIAVGMQLSLLGAITMISIGYLTFYDPLTYPLFIFIWVIIEILSVVASFLAMKFKLYEKKPTDLIRQKLGKTDKYLKISEYQEYLQLQAVKDYFMLHNKTWIVHNLHRIFSKEDFRQNNGALFNKYKEYKSAFKRRQIHEKKKLKEQILEEHYNNRKQSLFEAPYLIFRDRQSFNISKRISMYWYYLAKQNLYLKSIVDCVKKEQMQPICQFCKMDVELEVLEKKEFHQLANSYRVENVGRMFSEHSFLEYYRLNQEFITICTECKEHNYHLESKIDKKGPSSKIVLYWLLKARSSLLHKNKNKKEKHPK